jgi:hypothetical protein
MTRYLLPLIALLYAGMVYAGDGPQAKIDWDYQLHTLDGRPMRDGPATDAPPMTLKRLVAEAFDSPDKDVTPLELRRRGDLASDLMSGKIAILSTADMELAKTLIAKTYPLPAVVSQAFRLLDGKP